MKLSEKLAALEAEERETAKSDGAKSSAKGHSAHAREKKVSRSVSSWTEAKRKVRDHVLADLAPKLTGPKALNGPALEKEVKVTLDRILRREDVKVSPIE